MARRRDDVLGVAGCLPRKARHPEDPVPGGEPGDAEAHRLYLAGHNPLLRAGYRAGRGVPKHDELAKLWLEVARKFGSKLAVRKDFAAAAPTGKPAAAKVCLWEAM